MVVVVGGEPPSADDLSFAQQHAWVQLHTQDRELAAAYSGATALVYPSFYEGFGLPVLEAMTCGCPVVCGQGGSIPEVIGNAAFSCDVTRPQSIAAALNETLNPSIRFHKVHAGMKRAREFTWARMAEQVAEVVRQVA
jgi:glycosyltransferase involved in cell wall biosynthesis